MEERCVIRLRRENLAFDYLNVRIRRRNAAEERSSHRRGAIERTERASHRTLDSALHRPAILKPNLGLCGMDVYVDRVTGHGDFQVQCGSGSGRNGRSVRGLGGAHNSSIPDRASVDREEYASRSRTDICRTLDKTGHMNRTGYIIHVQQAICVLNAPERT